MRDVNKVLSGAIRIRADEGFQTPTLAEMPGGADDIATLMIADAAKSASNEVLCDYWVGAKFCESPIERMFLAAFLHPGNSAEYLTRPQCLRPPSGLIAHVSPPPIEGLYIWPQIEIGDYRVDFVVGYVGHKMVHNVIVECDGHDFHEKTKEQAAKDKSRDRYLTSQGYRVMRYTGSEIYNNAGELVFQLCAMLTDTQ